MNTKLKEGQKFRMGSIDCTITGTATFSGELHYGFTYVRSSGPTQLTEYGCGWMPVYFVENFTGYTTPEADATQRAFEANRQPAMR